METEWEDERENKLAYKWACKATFVLLWQWVCLLHTIGPCMGEISMTKSKPKLWLNRNAVHIYLHPGPEVNSGNQSMLFMRSQNSRGVSFGAQPSWYLGSEDQWETYEKLASNCNVSLKGKNTQVFGWGASFETHWTIELLIAFCFSWLCIGGFVLIMARAWLNARLNCNV